MTVMNHLENETYNINIKCSSCGETLLLFHSPGVMQHIFSLELHIYSLVAPIPAAQEVKLQVTRSKISYSLVKAQSLPCTPACGYQFHALEVLPPPNLQHL